ncbi:hypothetical protein B0H14DRAFT_2611376 [Mycena olivaceomarginata]|nr:hypothetical protein B0H14DRAFT_2611376 [Mycena olivaceomarginata]
MCSSHGAGSPGAKSTCRIKIDISINVGKSRYIDELRARSKVEGLLSNKGLHTRTCQNAVIVGEGTGKKSSTERAEAAIKAHGDEVDPPELRLSRVRWVLSSAAVTLDMRRHHASQAIAITMSTEIVWLRCTGHANDRSPRLRTANVKSLKNANLIRRVWLQQRFAGRRPQHVPFSVQYSEFIRLSACWWGITSILAQGHEQIQVHLRNIKY